MKKQLRTHPALKALAVILALVLGAGGFWASLFTLSQWDDIWTERGITRAAIATPICITASLRWGSWPG